MTLSYKINEKIIQLESTVLQTTRVTLPNSEQSDCAVASIPGSHIVLMDWKNFRQEMSKQNSIDQNDVMRSSCCFVLSISAEEEIGSLSKVNLQIRYFGGGKRRFGLNLPTFQKLPMPTIRNESFSLDHKGEIIISPLLQW